MRYKYNFYFLSILCVFILVSCSEKGGQEIQLTMNLEKNFDLDNSDNFTPDDKWLVYDTRTDDGGIGGCRTIEKINIETGQSEIIYESKNTTRFGPGVGAANQSHVDNKTIFIHGLANCNSERPYAQWRRTGVIIDKAKPDTPIFMDARDITPPFTPGALRGGTHRHEWSGDGKWIGFTYNDAIMKAYEDKTGIPWNLRTIGVSTEIKPVKVDRDSEGENIDGTWFTVLVVRVVPEPRPGSDEISRAAGDSWVGDKGYKKTDGSYQRARAFLGQVKNKDGQSVEEVFIVDIPERIDVSGEYGPLQGTKTTFPKPPKGTVQRRLTFTADTAFPGCTGVVRSATDGSRIAYVAKDKQGIAQVFFISPHGGEPVQVTQHNSPVQSGVRWHPNGNWISYVWDNSLVLCDVRNGESFGKFKRLTPGSTSKPMNHVWSHDGSIIAYNRLVAKENSNLFSKQIFLYKFAEKVQ